jgi:hypothetical protein
VSGNPATPDAVVPGPATRGLRLGPRGRSPGGRLRAARRRRPVDRMLPGPRSGGPRAPSLGHSGPGCTRRARDQRSTHRGRARRLPSSSWTAGPWTSFGTRRSFSATSTAATGTRSDSPATSQVRCFQARKALGEDLLPVIRLHHLRHTRHLAACRRRAGEGRLRAPGPCERDDHAHRLPARAPRDGTPSAQPAGRVLTNERARMSRPISSSKTARARAALSEPLTPRRGGSCQAA